MMQILTQRSSSRTTLLRELGAAKVRLAIHANESNRRLSLGIPSQTRKGDIVRSKAEGQIADFLFQHAIDYVYEPEITLGTQTLHPDFYLLDEGIYLEYWGLMSDPEYVEKMIRKLNLYQTFQIPLISLYQDDLSDLSGKLGSYGVNPPVTDIGFSTRAILLRELRAVRTRMKSPSPPVTLQCMVVTDDVQVRCEICKQFVQIDDPSLTCPLCRNIFHKSHLLEWIKIRGTCPYCLTSLKVKYRKMDNRGQ